MSFAKGQKMQKSYIVVYDVSDDGAANIQSCKAYDGDWPDNGIWIQVCSTKQEVERYVPDAVIQKAIELYLELNKI